MGIATPPPNLSHSCSKTTPIDHRYHPIPHQVIEKSGNFTNSMSQDYHQTIFSFSNGFERSTAADADATTQIRRDKLRVQGFEQPPQTLVGVEEEESGGLPVYETAGMLSEMFDFPQGGGTTADAVQLLESNYRTPRPPPLANEWYGNRNNSNCDNLGQHQHQISGINTDSAAAMHLFLMNPQPRSPSPPPQPPTSSTLHMLLPNPSAYVSGGGFGSNNTVMSTPSQFTWVPENNNTAAGSTEIGRVVEGQGLSLSLSSSLQHLEAAKAEELRMEDGGAFLYYNNSQAAGGGASSSGPSYNQYKTSFGESQHHQSMNHQVHVGFGSSSLGAVNVLRNSKYARAAQELLEEFCSVGRGEFKKNKFDNKHNSTTKNPNSNNPVGNTTSGGGGGSSSTKDLSPLSAADRIEHQRRKVKLLSMLDEVDRRYQHYCEQMQMVVNSFDLVMGFGAAVPYTALAQKAMSRHFRCLKDAIAEQLKHNCELLGEKDGAAGTSGITKGETPRLRLLEQSLRQQRAFHQMGIMEQEAWRPQRGLPERSVNILRAWLFEHFLHPYPSDADKHLLARQTGLSRNLQVSNWFINARVRLWKPMVEDMYQQEAKEEEDGGGRRSGGGGLNAQNPTPPTTTTTASSSSAPTIATTTPANENDTSLKAINAQCFSENQANNPPPAAPPPPPPQTHNHQLPFPDSFDDTNRLGSIVDQYHGTTTSTSGNAGSTAFIRFGAPPGDVSLTLGLRHAGNMPPDKTTTSSSFSARGFGGC